MTREEAIKWLKTFKNNTGMAELSQAFNVAIQALEQGPCEDVISRQAAIDAFDLSEKTRKYGGDHSGYDTLMKYEIQNVLENLPTVTPQQTKWIPVSERLPEHSYTKRFWLTVKLDDGKDAVTTLIGTWGAWGDNNGSKSYDAFDCWKDVMINGGIYRLSQPIPKEQVLAWMPLPEPYDVESEDKE